MHSAAKMVREEELLRLLLAGYMLKECALQLRLSYSTVRSYAAEVDFMSKLKELSGTIYERVDMELKSSKEEITTRLEVISDLALAEMERLIRSGSNDVVKFKAAQDVMDRDSRVSRTKRIEGTQSHEFMNPMTLRHIAGVAKEVDAYEARRGLPITTEEAPASPGDE